jgi:hypothetical protein
MEDSAELEKRAVQEEKRRQRHQRRIDGNQVPEDELADEYVPPVPKTAGESRRTVSWLWLAVGDGSDNDLDLQNGKALSHVQHKVIIDLFVSLGLRVEWAKAYARKRRWTEEVLLIKEEMRRTIEFHRYKAKWWNDRRASLMSPSSNLLSSGVHAYASRQAHLHMHLVKRFTILWSKGSNSQPVHFDFSDSIGGADDREDLEDDGGEGIDENGAIDEDVVEESDVYM